MLSTASLSSRWHKRATGQGIAPVIWETTPPPSQEGTQSGTESKNHIGLELDVTSKSTQFLTLT